MQEFAPLIRDLAIMLSLAGFVTILFQRIRQPVVLGYLIAGMILGPHTPPSPLIKDMSNLHTLSELGVIFLMFYLGLEFSFKKLTRVGLSAMLIGMVEVILMLVIGYLTGLALGFSHYSSIFLGAALAISSTTIIVKAIDELKLKTKHFAELIVGVLIVEDLLAILLLATLSTIGVTENLISWEMLYAAGKLVVVIGSWFFAGYFLVPPLFKRIANYISSETLTILSVALCLLLVWFAASLNYSVALGAFIMGSILAETTLINRIEKSIRPIRDIFAAVFFITVGMQIDPTVIIQHLYLVLVLSAVTIVGKALTTFLGAFFSGQSVNTSVRVGFSMAQIGEFSFIIVALGLSLNVIDTTVYPLVVAVSSITTFTTPYMIRLSGTLVDWLDDHLPKNVKFLLSSYSAWVYRLTLVAPENHIIRNVILRLLINGFVVAIIFSIVYFLVPTAMSMFPENHYLGNGMFLLLALTLALPFIWGMLFSYRSIKDNYPVFVVSIWLFTLIEVSILSIVYFKSWIALGIFIALAVFLFLMLFKQLEKSYQWFERRLISNMTIKSNASHPKYSELGPWDTHLVEIEVGDKSKFVDKTLMDLHIRQKYGLNIVAIAHGARIVMAPRGEEKLYAHDKLIVLGNDTQIDIFKKHAEPHTNKREIINILDHFALRSYLLEKNDPLIGKSIRTTKLREKIGGLIVGLERNGQRILNPDLEMKLQYKDILLLVGEADKLNAIS